MLIRPFEWPDLKAMLELIDRTLSESYSIFTYKYFVLYWPHLTFLAFQKDTDEKEERLIGVIVGSLHLHNSCQQPPFLTQSQEKEFVASEENSLNSHAVGYIAMLVVHPEERRKGLGKSLLMHLLQIFERMAIKKVNSNRYLHR
jgi:ribosomal protein S18 acetylase RimI-like enzyme